ncbi:MAG: Flp pilus assembly protein CpaB [Verrucomicrobia bacterium]|nr:Flp pilus assembly protein CpaB [Verrucomicrobiota bacterium]
MKQKIILLVALLAGLAAFILSKQYIENFKAEYQKQFNTISVIVAARDLVPGTKITRDDIGMKDVFAKGITGRVFKPDEAAELIGKKTLFMIHKLTPINWNDVDMPYRGLSGLSGMITRGDRAIAFAVDAVSAVSGHVKPNDHVDIIGTFSFPGQGKGPSGSGPAETVTLTILQDVTILATGKNTGRRGLEMEMTERFGGEQYNSVTVAVTPREAEMLIFASSKGKLALALRNREDVSVEKQLGNVDFQQLEKNFNVLNAERQQRLHPPLFGQPSAPPPAALPGPATLPSPSTPKPAPVAVPGPPAKP